MRHIVIALVMAVVPLAPVMAETMQVSTFLTKAEALEKKGALAIFSSDLKRLMNQVKADSGELRAANKAAAKAGRPKAYCTPETGVKMTNRDIMEAMRSVPVPQRAATSTKDALRAYIVRHYPCPAGPAAS